MGLKLRHICKGGNTLYDHACAAFSARSIIQRLLGALVVACLCTCVLPVSCQGCRHQLKLRMLCGQAAMSCQLCLYKSFSKGQMLHKPLPIRQSSSSTHLSIHNACVRNCLGRHSQSDTMQDIHLISVSVLAVTDVHRRLPGRSSPTSDLIFMTSQPLPTHKKALP